MNWLIALAPLIAKHGLPYVIELIETVRQHPDISPEAIDALKAFNLKWDKKAYQDHAAGNA